MQPKAFLHPTLAVDIRTRRESINSNVAVFISWSRLESLMGNSNEISSFEDIEAFVVTDDGLQFFVKGK